MFVIIWCIFQGFENDFFVNLCVKPVRISEHDLHRKSELVAGAETIEM